MTKRSNLGAYTPMFLYCKRDAHQRCTQMCTITYCTDTHTHRDCRPGTTEKGKNMLTHSAFSLKSGTPSNHPIHNHWQVPFKLLFFSCLRQTNSSLLSLNNHLFSSASCTSERKREGPGEREGGRNTSAPQSYTVGTTLMSCVLGPLGLGVWAPLSYNTVDKKPRAQPSGNLRGGVSRPGGQERGREGQNISGTLHLRWPINVQTAKFAWNKLCFVCTTCHKIMSEGKSVLF